MKKIKYLMLGPCILFVVIMLIIPMAMMIISTFSGESGFTFSSYIENFKNKFVIDVFLRSIRLSVISTLISAVVGFPVAYFIAKLTKHKGLYMSLALFPLMTSPVVRSFSWMIILGKKGMINNLLMSLKIINSPLNILYNEFSIVVGFVQLFLPLMILSLIGVIENIDDDLMLASGNLGASKIKTFWKVIFPLSTSGLMSGGVLVFCGCLTAYTTPQLLGGSKSKVMSTLIYQNAMSLNDWKSASVIAVCMIVASVIITEIIGFLAKKNNPLV